METIRGENTNGDEKKKRGENFIKRRRGKKNVIQGKAPPRKWALPKVKTRYPGKFVRRDSDVRHTGV